MTTTAFSAILFRHHRKYRILQAVQTLSHDFGFRPWIRVPTLLLGFLSITARGSGFSSDYAVLARLLSIAF